MNGQEPTLGNHPKGLYLLFTTEMWERMSFYGMRAILTLYMVNATHGGFGWSDKQALRVYALYTSLVYLTGLAGGYLADRYLGQRRAVAIGGFLMMLGHFLMAVPGVAPFFSALTLLICGNGLFKPNISTMVGGLYAPGDPRRDSGFNIFYMGINLGAMLGTFVCGTLGEKVSWHWGFASAGFGMALGLVVFLAFRSRVLGAVGLPPSRREPRRTATGERIEQPLTRDERDRLWVIVVLFLFASVFWAAFEQAGGLMNLFAERKVDRVFFGREMPATWFQNINSSLVILLSPLFAKLWLWLAQRDRDPSPAVKMGAGLIFLGLGFGAMVVAAAQATTGKAASSLLVLTYFLHTVGELSLSPVGLSLVTKLAPVKLASRMMGVWFLSNFVGNLAAGLIGGMASDVGEAKVFVGLLAAAVGSGILLLALSGALHRLMHGAADLRAPVEATHSAPEGA